MNLHAKSIFGRDRGERGKRNLMAGVGVKAIGNDLCPCPSLAAIFENRSPYARPASGKFPNGAISELSLNSGSFAAAPEWASRSAIVHSGFPDHFLRVLVAPEPHECRMPQAFVWCSLGEFDLGYDGRIPECRLSSYPLSFPTQKNPNDDPAD